MNNVWKIAAIAAGIASVLSSGAARADDDGSWEVRLRAVYLDPANKSDPIAALAVPANAIHINDKVLPDLDFEYFFTPNWSTELILTYPQRQKVTVEQSALGGPADIGTFKHLPPILTAKYDFLPNSDFQPYLGAGVNFTLLMDVDLNVPGVSGLDLHKRTSWGPAAQAGFDYKIAPHWYLNVDVKWAELRTHVTLDGTEISELKVDPLLFGVGIGYRFGAHAAPAAATVVAATPEPAAAAPNICCVLSWFATAAGTGTWKVQFRPGPIVTCETELPPGRSRSVNSAERRKPASSGLRRTSHQSASMSARKTSPRTRNRSGTESE